MSSADSFSRHWSFSETTFNQVSAVVSAIAADIAASEAAMGFSASQQTSILVTEHDLEPASIPVALPMQSALVAAERFVLLLSRPFCVMLCGAREPGRFVYRVALTFERSAIAQASQTLTPHLRDPQTLAQVHEDLRELGLENDAAYQSTFTLQLIDAVTKAVPPTPEADHLTRKVPKESLPAHQAAASAIVQQHTQQEQLISQVTGQIQRSLDLPVILQTALEQGRRLLHVDRLVIYQLNPLASPLRLQQTTANRIGTIIHEARRSDAVSSVLDIGEDLCFDDLTVYQTKYLPNAVFAVSDIEAQYQQKPCLLRFLREVGVKAKLVVPIVVQQSLWGFIIAHDCSQERIWQSDEQTFLQHIAEHLAIAISQAQLYEQLQQQTQNLEQRVIERTQELQDAMLAAQLASRAKGEFLSVVSHELRTPLTCIIGMSATLQRWTEDLLDDRQKNFLQIIHESGETLLELINNILDLSKLEAGKAVLNLSDFSITLLAQQILRTFQERADHRNIELTLDLQVSSVCDRCIADQSRMRQVLSNLLSNAIKFTNPGGQVTLRVVAETSMVILQVVDTGIGIPAQKLPLLFQKFQQLDASYQRNYGGVGLGLALIRQLVELHGGWIEVDSAVGVGSTFTTYFPQKTEDIPAAFPKATTLADKTAGRVVLIESDEDSASIVCDILNAADYQLIWMIESSMAIAQLEILQPELVLISRELADSDGYDIIRSLRQNALTRHLKILAILPTGDIEGPQYSLAIGASDWLVKPIVPEEVLVKVNALIASTEPETTGTPSL